MYPNFKHFDLFCTPNQLKGMKVSLPLALFPQVNFYILVIINNHAFINGLINVTPQSYRVIKFNKKRSFYFVILRQLDVKLPSTTFVVPTQFVRGGYTQTVFLLSQFWPIDMFIVVKCEWYH